MPDPCSPQEGLCNAGAAQAIRLPVPSSPRSHQQPLSAKQLHALGCSLSSSSGPSPPEHPAAGLWILGFWLFRNTPRLSMGSQRGCSSGAGCYHDTSKLSGFGKASASVCATPPQRRTRVPSCGSLLFAHTSVISEYCYVHK